MPAGNAPVRASIGRVTSGGSHGGSVTKSVSPCAHCNRIMNDFAGGYARGFHNELLCHPNAKDRPNCYKLVTLYNHETPCSKTVCYENHLDQLIYMNGK